MPIGLVVAGATRNDVQLARATLASIPIARPEPTAAQPQGLCLDQGDASPAVEALVDEVGSTGHIRARGEAAQALTRTAGDKARRWVVERTPRWMNRFRRIRIRWQKQPANDLGLLHLVGAVITDRAAGLRG